MRRKSTACLPRLTRRQDYLRVARGRRKAVMPGLVLQAAPMPCGVEVEGSRFGFTASKKVGNAVARNRARRRLKAVASDVVFEWPGEPMDFVLIARGATMQRSYDELLDDLKRALVRAIS